MRQIFVGGYKINWHHICVEISAASNQNSTILRNTKDKRNFKSLCTQCKSNKKCQNINLFTTIINTLKPEKLVKLVDDSKKLN